MGVTDDMWHHVCVVWEGERGLLASFKDGERNYQSNEFRADSLDVGIGGNEELRLFYVGGFVRLVFILTLFLEVNC